jgi:galactose mutarotase-like enzyme
MICTIHNQYLTCKIDSVGAEIISLVDNSTQQEHIWQIDDAVWGSSSPVLFPAIGKIKSGGIDYEGKTYDMPKHGIIRHNQDLSFEQYAENHCAFTLTSSEKTLKQYPFKFVFKVEYKLEESRLQMIYHIENRDEVDMYFACGGHTAYACPLDNNTSLEDYVIEFPKPQDLKAMTLGDTGLLSNRIRNIKTHNHLLYLSKTLFDEDALIFADIDFDWVRLRRKDTKKGIVVNFAQYPNLVLWAKPGADYVCIEPWFGLPDHEDESVILNEKLSYKKLSVADSYSITIETLIE